MIKNFGNVKVGDLITRIEGYKVETAKVLTKKQGRIFLVEGTETKKKYTIEADKDATCISRATVNAVEMYFADSSIVTALRVGIELGFKYARKEIFDSLESLKPVNPFFTVNGKPVE